MGQADNVVGKKTIEYEGVFSCKELYQTITTYLQDMGYVVEEIKHVETVKPDGKYITIELQPFKNATDYARFVQHINISYIGIKAITCKVDGVNKQMNEGKALIEIDSFLITDYENRWDEKPIYYLIRMLSQRYLVQPLTRRWKQEIERDTFHMIDNIKAFLNLSGKKLE